LFYGYTIRSRDMPYEDKDGEEYDWWGVRPEGGISLGMWGYLEDPDYYLSWESTVKSTDWEDPQRVGYLRVPTHVAGLFRAFAEKYGIPFKETDLDWYLVASSHQG